MCQLTRGLSLLLAPLLSFTAEEAYLECRAVSDPGLPESVFLDEFKNLPPIPQDAALNEKWANILGLRGKVNDVLDRERKSGVLRSSQEAALTINPEKMEAGHKSLFQVPEDWSFVFQMSEVSFNGAEDAPEGISIKLTKNSKCERCWRFRPDVGSGDAHPTLCGRCVAVVKEVTKA